MISLVMPGVCEMSVEKTILPGLPAGHVAIVLHVSWVRTGTLVTYEVRDEDNAYKKQCTSFVVDSAVRWTMVNHSARARRVWLLRKG